MSIFAATYFVPGSSTVLLKMQWASLYYSPNLTYCWSTQTNTTASENTSTIKVKHKHGLKAGISILGYPKTHVAKRTPKNI